MVSIPNGPSALAVKEAAWGLARYAVISQDNGLVPIVEPEILLDDEHGIERTFEVAQKVWAEVSFYLAENNVMFEGILLKPSMVNPGAESTMKATPALVADYTLKLLPQRIPPAVPGIMDQKKIQGQLIAEQEALFGSKPHPSKSGKKSFRISSGGLSSKRFSVGGGMLQTPYVDKTAHSSSFLKKRNSVKQQTPRTRHLNGAFIAASGKKSVSGVAAKQHS